MKRIICKRIAGITAFLLGMTSMGLLAMATPTSTAAYAEGPASNVWLSVVELQSQTRLSVTVPLSYGFAVVGSLEVGDTGTVTSENGKVLLSNVKVEVLTPSEGVTPGSYTVTVTGLPQVPLRNYSTDVSAEHMEEADPPREGLPVEVKAFVNEIPESLINRAAKNHYWKPIESDPTGDLNGFKRYRMGIDNKWFEIPGYVSDGTKNHSVYFLKENLTLPAPPDVAINGWNAGGVAKVPSISEFKVDVQVGGIQNQYRQVEQSVKVGQIGWQIIPGELP